MNYFKYRGRFRNWLARQCLRLANKLATYQTICDGKEKWKFQREWEAVPYRPEPHPFAKQQS